MKQNMYFPSIRCAYNPSSKNYFGFDVPASADKFGIKTYLRSGYGVKFDGLAVNSLASRRTKTGRRLIIKRVQ